MQIFPVLDVMAGQVVRGQAGLRESYRPIQSLLTPSCDPLQVAEAFQTRFGLSTFYLADLDAIRFQRPQISLIERLAERFPGLWLDAGIQIADDISPLENLNGLVFVAGLETLAGPQVLKELCVSHGPERMAFSLDLKGGKPLGDLKNWRSPNPFDIARQAIEAGVRKLIVLDLAQVGMGEGLSTLPLCQSIQREFPDIFLVTGGGIRHPADLQTLKSASLDAVLIASALHNGTLGRENLEDLR